MEYNSLLIVIVDFRTFMFYNLDFVTLVSLVGTSMEVACVFISFQGSSDLAVLLPQEELGMQNSAENIDNESSEGDFSR